MCVLYQAAMYVLFMRLVKDESVQMCFHSNVRTYTKKSPNMDTHISTVIFLWVIVHLNSLFYYLISVVLHCYQSPVDIDTIVEYLGHLLRTMELISQL